MMKHSLIQSAWKHAAAVVLGSLALGSQAQAQTTVSPADVAKLYQQHCASCHGAERAGLMGPALLPESLDRIRPAEVLKTIQEGRPATQMAGYAQVLNKEQIEAMAKWLRVAPSKAPQWTAADMAASHRTFVKPNYGKVKPVFQADPHNLFVVVEAGDHHVSVLDGDKFTRIARFQSHFALHGGPKFSPDGRFVYFGSRDGWVSQYDLYTQQKVAEIRVGLNTRNVAVSDIGLFYSVKSFSAFQVPICIG